MTPTFQRLLTRGDLPNSDGGCYNPSAWLDKDGKLRMLVRREVNYLWDQPSFPTLVNPETKEHTTLIPVGFQGLRIEDCRAFLWRGQTLVSHVAYRCPGGTVVLPVKQRLSVLQGDALVRWDDWDLPVPAESIEKNWVLGSNGDDLFCVYSLDPFVVCHRTANCHWELLHAYDSGLKEVFGRPLRNSTHLIPFDGGFLGFYHFYKRPSRYQTGAYWLDANLRLAGYSDVLIDGSWVVDDVYKAGVLYVSSAVLQGDELRLFAGEGDRHTSVATLSAADVRRAMNGQLRG